MFSPGIVAFVSVYLLILRFYCQDERRHAQAGCRPHCWRGAGTGWVCELCGLRLKAN